MPEVKKSIMVGQSGGPTAVINSSIAGVFRSAKNNGYRCYGMIHGIAGLIRGDFIDLSDYIKTDLDIELLKQTPAAWLGSCRYKMPSVEENEEIYAKIMRLLNELHVEIFIYAGGNDSMDTINKLSNYGKSIGSDIRFIGCPKTIDNDLAHTDHTPGFGSAAKYIATSVREMLCDAKSTENSKGMVTVVEIMGRNAGWLTGASALSKGEFFEGPDGIYLPEVDFDTDKFIGKVDDLLRKKPSVIMCVSEGVHDYTGKYICDSEDNQGFVDAFGHKQLSGTAQYLVNRISKELGPKTRAVELSILQRSASHFASLTDVNEAFAAGMAAVKAGIRGESAIMIVLERISQSPYFCQLKSFDVSEIANDERKVPLAWITGDNDNVSKEFIKYALPLIQGEVNPIMATGLPVYLPGPIK